MLPAGPMSPRFASLLALVGLTATAAAQPAPIDVPPPPAEPPADRAPEPASAEELAALAARLEALEAELARARAATPTPTPTPTPAAAPATAQVPVAVDDGLGFHFGSYGRVVTGSDLRGGRADPVHVVAHGPRIVEPSYLELDFAYGTGFARFPGRMKVVTTLAFDEQLFHETGTFTAGPALRNLYAEAILGDFSAWIGSRMLRGDDLYLFDYWPLDDLNTVGAGVAATVKRFEVSAHVGLNRLLDPFQYQERDVAAPELGATTVVQLNRQRTIVSGRLGYTQAAAPTELSWRARLYGEVHGLPSGIRRRDDATLEALPRDWGLTIGAELSAWGLAPAERGYRRHANLFARYSAGLAAFDELAAPTSFDTELRTFPRASELVFGLGANWDDRFGHVTAAAYARRFVDADRDTRDRDDGWEYAIDVRPTARLHRSGLGAALDLAYEARFPRGLQPTTQQAADAAIASIAPMLTFTPTGPSAFDRPELRLYYRAAHQNDGARALYATGDPRAVAWTHFLGVAAEWWWNSNSYR